MYFPIQKNLFFLSVFINILASIVCSNDLYARTLVLAADVWCPYNCEATSKDRGFMVDIVAEALTSKGYKIDYRNMSWTTAMDDALAGRIDGVIGAGASEAKDLVTTKEPLGINKTCFYAKSDSRLVFKGLENLPQMSLGVIAGYLYGSGIDKYIDENKINFKKVQLVTGDKPLLQNVKKVQAGRVDALVENEMVMNFSFLKFNIEGLKSIGCDKETPIYVAFSPKATDSKVIAETIDKKMVEFRRSGALTKILRRYGAKDWKSK